MSGFRLYEDVSCGWGSYYFLHKPLSDSFDAASVKDCADWCRANEFCRSFVFYGPKGGWRNIHGTWTDPGYEQKWKSKKILTCNTSYVLCHPEALRSLNDNKEFTRSYYEKIKLVND